MICHVTIRGVRRKEIYRDDVDRHTFLNVLRRVVDNERWHLLAYCLMGNHYHLVVEVPDGDLASGMRVLNSMYARRFNERHAYEGHLFEKRYWSDAFTEEERMLAAIGYVGRNPVRAGISRRAGDWPWSSVRAALGQEKPEPCLNVRRLWELVGTSDADAQARLREMYDEAAPAPGDAVREAVRRHIELAHNRDGLTLAELAEALQVPPAFVLKLMR
jgi:putative transposase